MTAKQRARELVEKHWRTDFYPNDECLSINDALALVEEAFEQTCPDCKKPWTEHWCG